MTRIHAQLPALLTGETCAAGTPIPMTAFARKVLSELPAPANELVANNLTVMQQFRNVTDKLGGKVDVTVCPALTLLGRFDYRDVDTAIAAREPSAPSRRPTIRDRSSWG